MLAYGSSGNRKCTLADENCTAHTVYLVDLFFAIASETHGDNSQGRDHEARQRPGPFLHGGLLRLHWHRVHYRQPFRLHPEGRFRSSTGDNGKCAISIRSHSRIDCRT